MKSPLIFALLTLVTLTACSTMMGVPTPVVSIPEVEDNSISASAKVVPETYATLAFTNGGPRVDVLVAAGDSVKAGQELARVDSSLLQLAVEQAEAAVSQAQNALATLEKQPTHEALKAAEAALINAEYNVNRTIDRGPTRLELDAAVAQRDSAQANLDAVKAGPTPEQLDSATLAVAQAQAVLDQARLNLAETQLKAPFDGTIVEVYLRDYENAAPGAPVVLLADLSRLKIETTDLSEIDAARLTPGMPLKISFDAFPGQDVTGKVGRIALKSSPGSGVNYTLEVAADSLPEGLRWGMSAFIVVQAP